MRKAGITLATALALVGCVESSFGFESGGPYCEEFSCVWQVEQGSLVDVSSWHKEARAHRMEGTPARITRRSDVTAFPDCMEVVLLADVAKDAQLELSFDFGADGSVETRLPVEPGVWKRRHYFVRMPASGRHLRTSFDKRGPGSAAIEYIRLHRGDDTECAALPVTTLADGSTCLDDASCTSGYCVLGKCSACGAGGCPEGGACRADKDCMGGACAAGVCRACALGGSCGKNDGCSTNAQCASQSCVFGIKPSLTRYPELDGVCGECNGDDDCPGAKCVLGQCAQCASDADCSGGLRCRYVDPFEAGMRGCVPRFDGILPRGALCEQDAECTDGLRCAAAPGRAKRCGNSCRVGADCGSGEVCAELGSVPATQASVYELLPSYASENGARVRTCYPPPVSEPRYGSRCQVHAQCPVSPYAKQPDELNSCCNGSCGGGPIDLSTGECNGPTGDYLFTWFDWGR